jgi:exopolysaccharide biosynthesis polyprenyl glycosylphosphotransferase
MFDDQKRYLFFVYIASDLICLAILFYLIIPLFLNQAFNFSFSILFEPIWGDCLFRKSLCVGSSLVFIFTPLVFMLVFKVYRKSNVQNIQTICYQFIILFVIASGILFIIHFFSGFDLKENIFFSIVSGLLLLSMLAANRIYIFYLIKKSSSNNNLIKYFLLVGTGFNAQSILNYIENHPECGLRITGFLTNKDDEIGKTISNKKILGKVDNLVAVVSEHYTDCVLYAGDSEYAQYHEFLLKNCSVMGIDFATTELEFNNKTINKERIFSENIGDIKVKIVKFIYISPQASFLKRVFDFTASLILIILCLPIWIVISMAIKLTSPGSVLFRQERIGKYGKKFILFKFRSMVVNAEEMQKDLMDLNEMDGPAFKIKQDPRQTVVGKFLRESSLDELPQLFNVLKGDISLVGPRPAIASEVNQYTLTERKRLSMMQGITCIWQVSGRNKIKFDEWMKLDLMYIETWSPAQDFRILIKTIPAVLLKKGAI